MAGFHLKFQVDPDDFLGHLTEAAYNVALRHGLQVPFTEIKLGLFDALREVIRKDMFVSDECGLHVICQEATQFEPWSDEAKKIYEKETE